MMSRYIKAERRRILSSDSRDEGVFFFLLKNDLFLITADIARNMAATLLTITKWNAANVSFCAVPRAWILFTWVCVDPAGGREERSLWGKSGIAWVGLKGLSEWPAFGWLRISLNLTMILAQRETTSGTGPRDEPPSEDGQGFQVKTGGRPGLRSKHNANHLGLEYLLLIAIREKKACQDAG